MTDDLVDRLVGGRYRVRERLGAGGMGAVYVALDTIDGDREVALKLIKDTLVDSAEAGARFDREAAALRHFEHENIVRFLDAGVDNGLRYIAMERLVGRTLKERIATRGSMPWRETLPTVRGIVSALEAAHARGLIHRDLKPENVMLVDKGSTTIVKLLDFGVAKHTQLPDGMTMTGTGIIVGTPGFVAPEVVLYGSSDDPRSDFYGLGATWFEMLTGTKPFDAATPFALAMRHVSERPPRPTDLRPFDPVPIPIEALLFRLLAKTPSERPATARALLDELDALEDAVVRGADVSSSSSMKTMTDMRTPQPTGMMPLGTLPPGITTFGPHTTPSTQAPWPAPIAPARTSTLSRAMIAGAVVAIVAAAVVVFTSTQRTGDGTTVKATPTAAAVGAPVASAPPVDTPIAQPDPVPVAPVEPGSVVPVPVAPVPVAPVPVEPVEPVVPNVPALSSGDPLAPKPKPRPKPREKAPKPDLYLDGFKVEK